MLAPLSWLSDYAPFEAPVEVLASALSGLGLVVEGVQRTGGGLGGVRVARVLSIRPHPDADRIRLVDVDAGGPSPLQIACGAWNFAVDDLVALAPVGTVLPGGMEIGRRKMRGQWSEGMLCSASELDLPDPSGGAGLMVLPAGLAAPGTPLTEALELGPDVVFDLDVTPNRPDALCMAGVARDLAAALNLPWAMPAPRSSRAELDPRSVTVSVELAAPDLCPRLAATVITAPFGPSAQGGGEGLTVSSPAWMARRLALAGMRPINTVVDASNYVMLDLGQPTHPYDLDRLGAPGLVVRRAAAGERIVTLDGIERQLEEGDCLICDADSTPVGIGGIMGGASSEITADTSKVLLEAAWFQPAAIARTGSRLGLHSEARVRFEHGVDPEMALVATERFIQLLGGSGSPVRHGPTLDQRSDAHLPAPAKLRLRLARVNAVLGTSIAEEEIPRLLEPIGFATSPAGEGIYSVSVPSWRLDCEREIDLIEEVARLHGYAKVPRRLPSLARANAGLSGYQRRRRQVREVMVGAGLSEAWTSTFVSPSALARSLGGVGSQPEGVQPEVVQVANPLDRDRSALRPSLLPGLLDALKFNADRQCLEVSLFEVGHVFSPPGPGGVLPREHEELAAVMSGERVDARAAAELFVVLAEALRLAGWRIEGAALPGMHPTRAATILGYGAGDESFQTPGYGSVATRPGRGASASGALGMLGEVDPAVVESWGLRGRVAYLALDLERFLSEPKRPLQAKPASRFPSSDVDLAFVVDDSVPAADLEATLRASGGDLLESVRLFDVYRGGFMPAGRRSLAFRLRFRAEDRTLGVEELTKLRQKAIEAATQAHGAELRA